jgi:DNA mismatch repair protein MutS
VSTPIRRQYLEIKRRYPHAIVFFRLGDFYETFDEDAQLVARELEITLTSKPMGKDLRVPLAGVPHHSLTAHLKKLVGRGYKVAVCEQMEDPKKAKTIVQREVVRVVTPGTVVEEALLASAANNYVAAVLPPRSAGERWGLAYADVTTGEFATTALAESELASELERIAPAEVVYPDGREPSLPGDTHTTAFDARAFAVDEAERVLRGQFGVASTDAFGLRGHAEAVGAAGALLAYVEENQRSSVANLRDLRAYETGSYLILDAAARRHLELFASARHGSRAGTLIEAVDATRTGMGARLLAAWLGRPLLDVAAIAVRQGKVGALVADGLRRAGLRETLTGLPDVERITGRIVTGSATPRDLAGLRRGLTAFAGLVEQARGVCIEDGPALLAATSAASEAVALIEAAVADDPAPTVGDGGVIRSGFSSELDEARALTGDVRKLLASLETEERERTGIRNLRVSYNRVFGYFIEVSKANIAAVPAEFERRQTLAGAERYTTPRLREYEERILNARERIGDLEAALFRQVCGQLVGLAKGLALAATVIAETDVYAALAECAARHGYVRPVVDDSDVLSIRDGRHPVVERAIGDGRFVPNDAELSPEDAQIVVLTGPNMAGKSTYLRQVALIVILAQAGAYVPAAAARIGVVDRIFTRIGAQDDLSRGESTFMVEMIETAAILRNATRRSLIVFDEVGRGTSTYDGLAIARSVVEYLHGRPERAAKTLFATHYHELTALAASLPRVRNYNVAVSEQAGKVVFLHRILPGGADRSYGIHVAELAGLPSPVIERARAVLKNLESMPSPNGKHPPEVANQLSLLAPPSAVESELAALDVDDLSPREALARLYELKAKLLGKES